MILLVSFLLQFLTVSARDNGLGANPLMGWNTWCTQNSCGVDWCSETEVLSVADAMIASGMQEMGYNYVCLDDCWGMRDLDGKITGDPLRFPSGMASLVDKLHSKGFKFGLYTSIGYLACHFPFVGSLGHYQDDADTFAEWKVDLVKFDNCGLPNDQQWDIQNLTCSFSDCLNKTGHPMWLYFHCDGQEWCAKCGNSYRVGPDHHDRWESTRSIIDGYLSKAQDIWGPYAWPDADFVYTGGEGCLIHSRPGTHCPGQTDREYITEFTIWIMTTGSLLVATDIRNMTDLQKKVLLNKEVLQVYNDQLGVLGIRVSGQENASVWARPLADGGAVAALLNLGEDKVEVTVNYQDIPQRQWNGSTVLKVRDLWEHVDMGSATGSFSATVEAHGTVLVKLSP